MLVGVAAISTCISAVMLIGDVDQSWVYLLLPFVVVFGPFALAALGFLLFPIRPERSPEGKGKCPMDPLDL